MATTIYWNYRKRILPGVRACIGDSPIGEGGRVTSGGSGPSGPTFVIGPDGKWTMTGIWQAAGVWRFSAQSILAMKNFAFNNVWRNEKPIKTAKPILNDGIWSMKDRFYLNAA